MYQPKYNRSGYPEHSINYTCHEWLHCLVCRWIHSSLQTVHCPVAGWNPRKCRHLCTWSWSLRRIQSSRWKWVFCRNKQPQEHSFWAWPVPSGPSDWVYYYPVFVTRSCILVWQPQAVEDSEEGRRKFCSIARLSRASESSSSSLIGTAPPALRWAPFKIRNISQVGHFRLFKVKAGFETQLQQWVVRTISHKWVSWQLTSASQW